jgi:hypothetical protein
MWAALAGLAGSIFAGKKQKDAMEAGAAREERLSRPMYDAQKRGLGGMWDTIQRLIAPSAGQASGALKAGHAENLERIEKQKANALAQSRFFNESTGNLGRGRGEALRIAQGATDALNSENLSYAGAQEDYKLAGTGRLFDALSSYSGQGSGGLSAMIGANRLRTQGASDFWDSGAMLSSGVMNNAIWDMLNKKKPVATTTGKDWSTVGVF